MAAAMLVTTKEKEPTTRSTNEILFKLLIDTGSLNAWY